MGCKVSGNWKYVWRRRETEAKEVYEQLCAMRDEHKANISRKTTTLTDSQVSEAEIAVHKLSVKYGSENTAERRLLIEAVELFIKKTPSINAPILHEVVDMFVEYKKARLAEVTHRDYVRVLNKFRSVYGDYRVNDIHSKDVREFFDLYNNKRCRATHQYLKAFFEFCCGKDNPFSEDGRGWLSSNPIHWLPPSFDWLEPDCLTFNGIVNVLMLVGPYCSKVTGMKGNQKFYSRKANDIIAYYIFRLFSMMRTSEFFRLVALGGKDIESNKFIDWERRRLLLTPEIYKKRGCMTGNSAGRIFEPICDTFYEWMCWMRELRIPLSVPSQRKGDVELKEVCKAEQLRGNNILRHTGITYHLLNFKDLPLTTKCAGTSLSMIQKHYWSKNHPTSDAECFYQLTPKKAVTMGIISKW